MPAGHLGYTYPAPPQSDAVDDYFGTRVADPYRPLEDIDANETRAWVAAESALTTSYFEDLPQRDALRARLAKLYDYQRVSPPAHESGTYVRARNPGLLNQPIYYVSEGEDGPERVLLDPNGLSSDGTVSVDSWSLSRDGKLFAYGVQQAGSDWMTWRVREVASGRDLPDTIRWSKFSNVAWAADGGGFYYSAFDAPVDPERLNAVTYNQKAFFHRLGTAQENDELVYAIPEHPEWFASLALSEDGRYLIYYSGHGEKDGVSYRDLENPASPVVQLFPPEIARYVFVDNDGPLFYFYTTEGSPRGRLVAVDVRAPGELREILPEHVDVLEGVASTGGRFFASYLRDAHSDIRIYDRAGGELGRVALPGIGSAGGFYGHRDDTVTYYWFTSYTAPATIYRYEIATGRSTVLSAPQVDFDAERYATEQVFATSKDGTRVPIFISYRRGLLRDGSAPAILYGYGGFNVSLTPAFSAAVALWLELGGVYAVANLRGGGEYGEDWHLAGSLERKQNVFDDFLAAADFLVERGYTSRDKLALKGGSNGGLLVAACIAQRPAICGAALVEVGVLDMLRYQHFTIGHAWIPEFGSAEAGEEQFRTLFAYSPLHALEDGRSYPATLISTADHDDRVFPAHSFKFAAALQRAQGGAAPILLFVESSAGHGAGKPLRKAIDESADQYAFLIDVLGLDVTVPPAS